MSTEQTIHYATLIRLQAAMSALQDLTAAARDFAADSGSMPDYLANALRDADEAIAVALGGQHQVPLNLTRNWADRAMVRDALYGSLLEETAR